MQHYKVKVSEQANFMLAEHSYFLARVSIEAAEKLMEDMAAGFESLSVMPERCPLLNQESNIGVYRKLLVAKWYLVIYKVVEDTVYVDYVLDGRGEYRSFLRGAI